MNYNYFYIETAEGKVIVLKTLESKTRVLSHISWRYDVDITYIKSLTPAEYEAWQGV